MRGINKFCFRHFLHLGQCNASDELVVVGYEVRLFGVNFNVGKQVSVFGKVEVTKALNGISDGEWRNSCRVGG